MRFRDIILALSLFISTQAMSAGIPVFDAVQNTESMNQWIQKLQQWQETVTHYRSELDAYKQQLATATGVRDVQAFLREAKSLKTDIDNLRQNGISLDDLLSNQSGHILLNLIACITNIKHSIPVTRPALHNAIWTAANR